MQALDLERFTAAPPAVDPFAHVIVPQFVRSEVYEPILQDLPRLPKGGSFPVASVKLGPSARALLEELEGPAFRQAVAKKFGLDLEDAATMTTLRARSREKDGRIHTDSKSKRVTILLYLNRAQDAWSAHEGCLRLLRSPDCLDDYAVEVPPVDGTLLVFPNGERTWHGHKTYVGERHVLQMNYMSGDDDAQRELRRHKVSAFLKKIF